MPRLFLPADSRPSAEPGAVRRRFASADLRALLSRRLMELCGLLAAIAALGLAAALLSYDPADPSLNTATARPVSNLAGPVGAVVADILLQGFGYAAALPLGRLGYGARGLDLHHLFVRPEARGLGIGRALVRGVEDLGRDLACRYVIIGTHPDNLIAQAYYRHLGYAPHASTAQRFTKAIEGL